MYNRPSSLLLSLGLTTWGLCSLSSTLYAQTQGMNVLFIIADDLRPELGCYGVPYIHTPNIDRLAREGIVFDNAYCNVPVSGASRASLFTGMYPHYPDRFVNYTSRMSVDAPTAIPLSGWMKSNGYYTLSDGKVYHHIDDHADSWSEPPYRRHPNGYDVYWAEYNKWELWMSRQAANEINPKTMRGPFCEQADVPDNAYDDGKLAERTIANLTRLKTLKQPFMLACGFWKPHLPFNAPKRYWDLYDRDSIPMPIDRTRPAGLPSEVQNSREITAYGRVGDLTNEDFQREVKHGYYACVSYVDAQIGKVLDALEDLGLKDQTIVILIGDHGWNLGEHNFIGKHNLMQTSCHIPMIISIPGYDTGRRSSMVELVDLYPTLCDLCGIPYPKGQLQGVSFVSVLKNRYATTKDKVYIQWQGGNDVMTPRYNYAEWLHKDQDDHRMLFDHLMDPHETTNRADSTGYDDVTRLLSKYVREMYYRSTASPKNPLRP